VNDTDERQESTRSAAHEQEMQFILRTLEVAANLVENGRAAAVTLEQAVELVRRRPLPEDVRDRVAVQAERGVLYTLISRALEDPSRANAAEWACRVYHRRIVRLPPD
jgi:hypothetical protein